ncbi:MAG: AAA family ATPase [Pseudomonadales bacterium]
MTKTLVIIFGPPAVGKMTVGRELSKLSGLKLFHNHMTIEPLLELFDFGSPPFSRLLREFRRRIFEEVASDRGPGLIFTYVWALDEPEDRDHLDRLARPFVRQGARICYVELFAPTTVLVERNRKPDRLLAKPSKRDVQLSEARLLESLDAYRLSSGGKFPFEGEYLYIENSALTAALAAEEICDRFGLRGT